MSFKKRVISAKFEQDNSFFFVLTCITIVVTKSEQFSASSLETQGGVAYPTAEIISASNPNSSLGIFLSIIAINEAIAPPRE